MADLPPPPPAGGFVPPPPPPGTFGASAPGPPTGAPSGPAYAGFWVRFVAALIDGFVTGFFAIPAQLVFANGETRLTECTIDSSGTVTGFGDGANGVCEVPTSATIALAIGFVLVAIAASAIYYGLLDGKGGQSLGKKAMSIRVADVTTGAPIGFGRGVGRYLFKFISAIVFMLGFLWALWDPRKQTWHDKAVRSVVVKA